jgi:hypothetical protein
MEDDVTIVAGGGIGAVLEAMKMHKDSAGVQNAACDALFVLACNIHNRVTIAAAGGIGLVLQEKMVRIHSKKSSGHTPPPYHIVLPHYTSHLHKNH